MVASNHGFWRALHSLSNPVTIAAMLLLLFNDHYLRHQHPSWVTGKLGDFTWLVFAPFIAALFFALILPRRIKQHERLTGLVSFMTIGAWFTLAKTVPLAHHLTTTVLDAIVGWQGSLRMDVTDLLTLPALLIGWYIWQNVPNTTINLRPVSYVAFGLGLLGTMATSQSPRDGGIDCIIPHENRLIISGINLASEDGGLTWEPYDSRKDYLALSDSIRYANCSNYNKSFELHDPIQTNAVYRFVRGIRIERSNDGGQSWLQEVDLSFTHQDAWLHYHEQKALGKAIYASPGPLGAVFDEKSGNLVVAMGHDGILVRPPSGEWQWIEVMHYHKARLDAVDLSLSLNTEYPLALVLIMLIFGSALKSNRHWLANAILILVWGLWFFCTLYQPPKIIALYGWDFRVLTQMLYPFMGFLAIITCVLAMLDFQRNWKHLAQTLILMFLSTALFFLPYFFWVNRTIPVHGTATLFALLLGGGTGIIGSIYLQPKPAEKEKRKNEDKAKSDS